MDIILRQAPIKKRIYFPMEVPFPMSQFKTICLNRYSVFTVSLLYFIYYSSIAHSRFPLCSVITFPFLQRLLFFLELTVALLSFSQIVVHLSWAHPPNFRGERCKELIAFQACGHRPAQAFLLVSILVVNFPILYGKILFSMGPVSFFEFDD